jgi:radical S-adenosyl methionine domain-containing protein 2
MKITLSGLAGSGKSTIGKLVAKQLSCEFTSVGSWTRDFALQHYNMSINEFQDFCKLHPEMDQEIDRKMVTYCNEQTNLVIDYRLGFHFIQDALHVFLTVSEEEAHRRISTANRSNEKTDLSDIAERNQNMRDRFLDQYGVDFTHLSHYDLVIDTEKNTLDEIVGLILNGVVSQ